MRYQIRVQGELTPESAMWCGDFAIGYTPDGDTLMIGEFADQAALYGTLARCRDLGFTLIALYPMSFLLLPAEPAAADSIQRNLPMNTIKVEYAQIINARPEDIWAIITDYHVGHLAILPKPYFTGMVVEQGGIGAGTVVTTRMKVFGQEYVYHQAVTEPEPGRVLVETDTNTGQYSMFTLDPINDGQQTRVTIASVFPREKGIQGWLQSLTQPPIVRNIYKKELQNLAAYLAQQTPTTPANT